MPIIPASLSGAVGTRLGLVLRELNPKLFICLAVGRVSAAEVLPAGGGAHLVHLRSGGQQHPPRRRQPFCSSRRRTIWCDLAAFGQTLHGRNSLAREGWLVTFNIRPAAPETSYDHIKADHPVRKWRAGNSARSSSTPPRSRARRTS